jgi:glucose/mannose-6-phosphate isomerase
MGWTSHPAQKPFAVVQLESSLDHPQIKKRFQVTNKLLAGKMPKPIEVKAEGTSRIEQLLWAIQLGDFTSLYLAVLNGVDPTPVDLIENLKKELG